MKFQFTEVLAIQQQIEELKKQIAPYLECEAIALDLVFKVGEHRKMMVDAGVSEDSLKDWAIALHEAIGIVEFTGKDLNLSIDSSASVAKLEARIKELESEGYNLAAAEIAVCNTRSQGWERDCKAAIAKIKEMTVESEVESKKLKDAIASLEGYQDLEKHAEEEKARLQQKIAELENLTDALDQDLVEEGINREIEKEVLIGKKVFQLKDIVKVTLTGLVGEIVGIQDNGTFLVEHTLNKVKTEQSYYFGELWLVSSFVPETIEPKKEAENAVLGSPSKFGAESISPPTSPQEEQFSKIIVDEGRETFEEFLTRIARSSVAWNGLTWKSVKMVIKTREDFSEFAIATGTKVQKERRDILFSTRFAELLAYHIETTGDRSDLEWIPSQLVTKVKDLLEQKSQTGIPIGTEINVAGERNRDGEMILFQVRYHDIETNYVDCFEPVTKRLISAYIEEVVIVSPALSLTSMALAK